VEFEASSNIIKTGLPSTAFHQGIIDEPPLGFYVEAAVFQVFGLSLSVGETLVTLFGLSTVVAVFLLGRELYGKSTGLLAATLFGLTPWQLILSRTFLIDAQCLFFSLFCLYAGVLAIRKNSITLSLLSGVLFAAALLTKLYAVFVIIPLLLFYLHSKPKATKSTLAQLVTFILPAVVSNLGWYTFYLGGFSSIVSHNDFIVKNASLASPWFVLTFLNNYGIGFFFVITTIFSLSVCFGLRKQFQKILIIDIICMVTIAIVLGVDMFLGAGLNLRVPYANAIKYDYQALPFFCLIVASLTIKIPTLFKSAKSKIWEKMLFSGGVVVGAFLLVASIVSNMRYANEITTLKELVFRPEQNVEGFHLFNYNPITPDNPLMITQYIGFAIVLFGLVLLVSYRIVDLADSFVKNFKSFYSQKKNK
jgi:4-amino-4-deoxy-L-arabinose transferase-like glycosyltransferase